MRAAMVQNKESIRSYDRRCRNLTEAERTRFESEGAPYVIRFKVPLEGQTAFQEPRIHPHLLTQLSDESRVPRSI